MQVTLLFIQFPCGYYSWDRKICHWFSDACNIIYYKVTWFKWGVILIIDNMHINGTSITHFKLHLPSDFMCLECQESKILFGLTIQNRVLSKNPSQMTIYSKTRDMTTPLSFLFCPILVIYVARQAYSRPQWKRQMYYLSLVALWVFPLYHDLCLIPSLLFLPRKNAGQWHLPSKNVCFYQLTRRWPFWLMTQTHSHKLFVTKQAEWRKTHVSRNIHLFLFQPCFLFFIPPAALTPGLSGLTSSWCASTPSAWPRTRILGTWSSACSTRASPQSTLWTPSTTSATNLGLWAISAKLIYTYKNLESVLFTILYITQMWKDVFNGACSF